MESEEIILIGGGLIAAYAILNKSGILDLAKTATGTATQIFNFGHEFTNGIEHPVDAFNSHQSAANNTLNTSVPGLGVVNGLADYIIPGAGTLASTYENAVLSINTPVTNIMPFAPSFSGNAQAFQNGIFGGF